MAVSVRLFFVRHGESESNSRDDYYNDESAGLTRLGEHQAEEVGRELKKCGVQFGAVFCSPYRRAIDTCRIAMDEADIRDMSVIVDNRLGERRFDGLVGRRFTRDYNRMLYDYNSRRCYLDGVESLESMERRARWFIDDVVEKYRDGDFLVFSHSAFGLAFRAVIEGRPATGNLYDWELLKNGEVKVYIV